MTNTNAAAITDIEYQRAHLSDSRVSNIIISIAICQPLACLAVILRVLSRRLGRIPFKADDWCIVIALAFSSVFTACALYVTHLGLGRHEVLMKDPTAFAKGIIAKEVVYNPAIVAIKTSILLLYRRIFTERNLNKPFKRCLWGTGAFVLAYSLAQAILTVFHCTPVKTIWDPTVKGSCINFDNVLIVLSSINVGTDLVILCLPLPQLWKLQMAMKQKLQLTAMFLLGGFVCIVSVIRVPAIAHISLSDPSWSDVYGAIWSVVELNVGIVSACLPTLRPLFLYLFEGKRGTKSPSTSAWSQGVNHSDTPRCFNKPRTDDSSEEWGLTDVERSTTTHGISMKIEGGKPSETDRECLSAITVVTELDQRSAY